MRVVIIGGGTAGVSVATHLRRNDENAEIIILEKSDEFAISSCGLPYILSNRCEAKHRGFDYKSQNKANNFGQ